MSELLEGLVAGVLAEACVEYHRLEAADASDGEAVNLTPFVRRILSLVASASPRVRDPDDYYMPTSGRDDG